MSTHVIEIGKHKFVCGLFWQSLSRPRELQKEAADLAKKIDFDLMVLRRDHTTAQAGFAQARDGVRKGMASLAAAVSKTMALEGAFYDGEKQPVHNWLAAFRLSDGMWAYFAVRDANFLPNGDFAGTKEEVLERLHGDYGLGGWNLVIGDAELENHGFHNFNAKRIEDVLPKKSNGHLRVHRWWGLRPVKRNTLWKWLGIGSVVVIAATAVGVTQWQKYKKKKEDEAREIAIENARRAMQNKPPAPKPPNPWVNKPSPAAFVQSCLANFTHVTAGGWHLDDYACNGVQATYAWSRQASTIAFLLEQVPNAVVDIGGDKATLSVPQKAGTGDDEILMERNAVIQPLISRMQLLNVSPKVRFEPPPAPQGNALLGTTSEAPPAWQTYRWSLNANGVPLMEIAEILNQPGTRIEKMLYRGGSWSIEGVVYAK